MAGSFVYTSWNIKQLSDRITDSVSSRVQSTDGKKKRAYALKGDTTPVANLHAKILDELGSDVVAVMEGVQDEASCKRAGVAIASGFAALKPGRKVAVNVSPLSGHDREDRYLVLHNDPKIALLKNPAGDFIAYPNHISSAVPTLTNFVDRYPARFLINVTDAAPPQIVCCFVWHAPQPAHTQGKHTIDQLAKFIADSEADTSIATTHIVVSGDFNINTADTGKFVSLVKPPAGTTFTSLFEGLKTTMRASHMTKLKSGKAAKIVEDALQAGKYDDSLMSPYDDILISGTTLRQQLGSNVRVILSEWTIGYLKSKGAITTAIITRANASDAMLLANEVSDHIPVSVTLDIL